MAVEVQEEDAVARPDTDDPAERSPGRTWTRWLPTIFFALALLAAMSGAAVWILDRPPSTGVEISLATPIPAGPALVHVTGAVAEPGLYELEPGSRVAHAIESAGGALPGAGVDSLNLAAVALDGQRIEVPLAGQMTAVNQGQAEATGDLEAEPSSGLVDLNTASRDALESLPNIGPARARAIIDWRETHGSFESLDALQAVPGIGPETVAGLRGLVVPG